MTKLLDKQSVASMLDISLATLDRERVRGHIRAVRVGQSVRFEPEEVQRYIVQHREEE